MPSGHDWKREYERGRRTPVVATDLDPRFTFDCELAVEADPRLGDDIYIKLGAIALEISQTGEAGVLWRRALEINPENHSLQAKLDQIGASAGT